MKKITRELYVAGNTLPLLKVIGGMKRFCSGEPEAHVELGVMPLEILKQ